MFLCSHTAALVLLCSCVDQFEINKWSFCTIWNKWCRSWGLHKMPSQPFLDPMWRSQRYQVQYMNCLQWKLPLDQIVGITQLKTCLDSVADLSICFTLFHYIVNFGCIMPKCLISEKEKNLSRPWSKLDARSHTILLHLPFLQVGWDFRKLFMSKEKRGQWKRSNCSANVQFSRNFAGLNCWARETFVWANFPKFTFYSWDRNMRSKEKNRVIFLMSFLCILEIV